jgi:NADH-quinone oxidoreductase subunit G
LPGYKKTSDGEARKKYEEAWGGGIPSKDGKDIRGMLELAFDDKLGALYVLGEDILGTYPDRGFVEKALNKTKFLIAQDSLMTETAKVAHVVLPSQGFLEYDGSFTNSEGRVQRLRKVFNMPYEAESNLAIFNNILMIINGSEISKSSAEVFNEVAEMVSAYDGLNFEHIGERSSFCNTDEAVKIDKFYIPEQLSSLCREEKDYPFYLQSGNHLYHSDVMTQEVEFLKDLLNEPFVELSAKDADTLGLKDGDKVKITGENGGEVVLKLKINPLFPEKVVFIPDNFKESRVNNLVSGKEAPQRVNISKI